MTSAEHELMRLRLLETEVRRVLAELERSARGQRMSETAAVNHARATAYTRAAGMLRNALEGGE